jgi:hypothetical protein
MSAFQVKLVVMLNALQQLIFFAETLKYLETKLFLLIVFYNGTPLIIKILIVFNMNV